MTSASQLQSTITEFIDVIDCHTAGEPTRVVTDYFWDIPGINIHEKREHFKSHFNHYRTSILNEPRGHADLFGAVLTRSAKADIGVFFMDNEGYLSMCGHGAIGVAHILSHQGKPFPLTFETPSGIVKVTQKGRNRYELTNVRSYRIQQGITINTTVGPIYGDIYYGGNVTFLVDTNSLPFSINTASHKDLISIAMQIKNASSTTLELIEYSFPIADKKYRNFVVFGNGQYDRSPCGTGSSAKLAQLHNNHVINDSSAITFVSPHNTEFTGKIIAVHNGVIPKITGAAHITGFNTLVLNKNDPLRGGFSI